MLDSKEGSSEDNTYTSDSNARPYTENPVNQAVDRKAIQGTAQAVGRRQTGKTAKKSKKVPFDEHTPSVQIPRKSSRIFSHWYASNTPKSGRGTISATMLRNVMTAVAKTADPVLSNDIILNSMC